MTLKRILWVAALLAGVLVAAVAGREILLYERGFPAVSAGTFVKYPLPTNTLQELMDLGVADVDGNGYLDLFTSNHNFRQYLWLSDGKGGFHDALSEWGLDQYPELPGMEISRAEPELSAPGVYIYWKGYKTLSIRTHKLRDVGTLHGTMRGTTALDGYASRGIVLEPPKAIENPNGEMPDTVFGFAADGDGSLDLQIDSPGVPITVALDGSVPLSNVFVGAHKISPRARQFELRFQDRHGLAWADYNNDGILDVFISRGAIGGTLRAMPPAVARTVKDELLVSQARGHFVEEAAQLGIHKKGCSGRKPMWVDIDNDGRLDLFINCVNRGRVEGVYLKQLYRQTPDGRFVDVASDVGLSLPEDEIIDYVWYDFDNDGYADLLTYEATGFYWYRNHAGKSFSREFIGRGKFVRADNPRLRATVDEYWFFDGKLAVADFDGNGTLDVFCSSKRGNMLLLNDGKGHFTSVDPTRRGLPDASATANWVDYDNDGRIDLHAVPQGLFRQKADHTFEATRLLQLPAQQYMAAIVNWPDLENHGRRDVVMAVLENFAFWRWWEKPFKVADDRWTWRFMAYRNEATSHHWLEVALQGRPGNPQAIGARATVVTPNGEQLQAVGQSDGAFFSQGHYRLYFGLGSRQQADALRIRWPDGSTQELRNVAADRVLTVAQSAALAAVK